MLSAARHAVHNPVQRDPVAVIPGDLLAAVLASAHGAILRPLPTGSMRDLRERSVVSRDPVSDLG
jgi:hypothetical protein